MALDKPRVLFVFSDESMEPDGERSMDGRIQLILLGVQKALDGKDAGNGGDAEEGLHRAGVVDDHLTDQSKQQHVEHGARGMEGQEFDKLDPHDQR